MRATSRTLLFFFCLTLMTVPSTTRAGESPDEAMAVLDSFMHAFNRRDIEAWAATLNYPHVRFASGTVSVYQSAEEFTDRPVFDQLSATGWDHSHWITREVILASPGKVHIATTFERFNAANESIGQYASLYIVTRVNGRWGIQARSSLAP